MNNESGGLVRIDGGRVVSGGARLFEAARFRQTLTVRVDGVDRAVLAVGVVGERVQLAPFWPESYKELPCVLPLAEAAHFYLEGVDAFHAGKQFHENPHAKPLDRCAEDEWQRGYEWRRGWNDAALGRA